MKWTPQVVKGVVMVNRARGRHVEFVSAMFVFSVECDFEVIVICVQQHLNVTLLKLFVIFSAAWIL